MVPGAWGTGINGSSFVRLLTELSAPEVAQSPQSLAERLGGWLDWTDAISLAAVLNEGAAPATDKRPALPRPARAADEACTRVRADLARSIGSDALFAAGTAAGTAAPDAAPASAEDFLPYRRSYATHQRAMATRIGALRAELRAMLAKASATGSRLAALDAVMEEALGPRERSVLATVPALLEQRFDRLRQVPPPAGGPTAFGQDMHRVLLAELDVRMQPVEGLLAALGHEGTRPQ